MKTLLWIAHRAIRIAKLHAHRGNRTPAHPKLLPSSWKCSTFRCPVPKFSNKMDRYRRPLPKIASRMSNL